MSDLNNNKNKNMSYTKEAMFQQESQRIERLEAMVDFAELEKSMCEKCHGTGFFETEIYGDGNNFEWGVIGTQTCHCDNCF